MIQRALILLMFLCCTGCSAFVRSSMPLDIEDESPEPFKLEIVDEVNDGEQLHVMARLTPRTDWPADSVVVRLKGMREGRVLDFANYLPGSPIPSGPHLLKGGRPLEFSLAVRNAEISEYQLELLWGDDAVQYRQILKGDNRSFAGVDIRDVRLILEPQLCGLDKCPEEFAVLAELCNNSARELSEVLFGLKVNSTAPEEQIKADELGLASGERQSVRIKLPDSSGRAASSPQLRVISYKFR